MSSYLLGAAALSAGIGSAGNIVSSIGQYHSNKQLQEDSQAFNAEQAQLARDFASKEAASARAFNAEQAQLARDFEATKYQRTVEDMKAAGLNPASIGMSPPSGGSPQASSAMASASPAASSGINSVGSSNLGNILSSAFDTAMIQSMKDKRFAESLVERTAYHAKLIASKLNKASDPKWFDNYKKNFESGVSDL